MKKINQYTIEFEPNEAHLLAGERITFKNTRYPFDGFHHAIVKAISAKLNVSFKLAESYYSKLNNEGLIPWAI